MKVRLVDGYEVEVSAIRVYRTKMEGYEPNVTLVISGDRLDYVLDEEALKNKFTEDNIKEVKFLKDKKGVETIVGSYKCSGLKEFAHNFGDYEERIDIVLLLEQ